LSSKFDLNTKCDFELDTKTCTKFSRDPESNATGAAEQPPNDKGHGKDKFWDDQEKDDEFRKAEKAIDVFRNFAKMLNVVILGSSTDTLLLKMNSFLKNLSMFRIALVENGFPLQIVSLIYSPIIFVVMFLNCLRV
jgi:hypothetical protein